MDTPSWCRRNPRMESRTADTIPWLADVNVASGRDRATMLSPARIRSESPSVTTGTPSELTFRMAMSLRGSTFTTDTSRVFLPSGRITSIPSASAMAW